MGDGARKQARTSRNGGRVAALKKRPRLVIRRVPVGRIRPAAYNPRKDLQPGDPEYEALRRSIDRWDLVEPLIWNERSGNLVGGHQRFKILLARGDSEVDVSVVDLDEHDEAALNIALNRIGGEWDLPRLAALLSTLDAVGFDVGLTGWGESEVEALLLAPELESPAGEVPEQHGERVTCPKCGFAWRAEG